jgi:hypothetical protein
MLHYISDATVKVLASLVYPSYFKSHTWHVLRFGLTKTNCTGISCESNETLPTTEVISRHNFTWNACFWAAKRDIGETS